MRDKFEEDEKLFSGLYYTIGKHRVDSVSQSLEDLTETVENLPYPEDLNTWFNDFLTKQKKEEKALQNRKRFHLYSKNVAIFALLLTSALTLTTFSVEAFRTKVFNIVSEISEKYSKIEFVEKETPDSQALLIPWDTYFYPENLPEDYVLESAQQLGDVKLIYFTDPTGDSIEFSQSPNHSSYQVDTENAQTKKVAILGGEGLLIGKDGVNTLVWTNNESTFYLMGTLSEEALVKMAESVVLKNK